MKSTDKAGVQFPDSEVVLLLFVGSMFAWELLSEA
jgi:hypothetical protein